MHYALIESNVVQHVLRVPPENIYPAEVASQYTPCSDAVQVGWLWNGGEFVAPPPEPEPEPQIPQSVTRRQARQALLLSGLLGNVQPAIDSIPDPIHRGMAQIEWDDSQAFERNRPLLIQIGMALGLDDAGLDALFVQAAAL